MGREEKVYAIEGRNGCRERREEMEGKGTIERK